MRKKKNMYKLFLSLLFLQLLISCDESSDEPNRLYVGGVVVLNEGNFTDGDASLSFIDTQKNKVHHGLFNKANKGLPLGDVANDAVIVNDRLYVVVNNSNKIEVLDAKTLQLEYTLSSLSQPRGIAVHGGIGYVSEWGIFPDPARISIFDLETGMITGSLEPGNGAEDMVFVDRHLYVSNQFEHTLSVIDIDGEDSTLKIDTGSSPDDLVIDDEGKIWVICGGGYDFETFAPLNDGKLQRIDPKTNVVELTIDLNQNVTGRLAMNAEKTYVFYLKGHAVYKMAIASKTAPESPLLTVDGAVSLYGLGVDPENGDVYVLDSNGFQTNGKAYRYDSNGEWIDTYDVGRGPNKVLFN